MSAANRPRPGRRAVGCAAVVVAALLTGCSSGAGRVLTAGEVSVLVAERAGEGMDALGGGTLEVVGGCLGASGTVIVWPHGTRVAQSDPLRIEIPGVGAYALGDRVEVGGGYVVEHSSGAVEPGPLEVGGVVVPEQCAAHDVFLAR